MQPTESIAELCDTVKRLTPKAETFDDDARVGALLRRVAAMQSADPADVLMKLDMFDWLDRDGGVRRYSEITCLTTISRFLIQRSPTVGASWTCAVTTLVCMEGGRCHDGT